MALFIVKGSVIYHPYMGSSQKPVEVMHPVEADSEYDASQKFEKYYRDMSVPNDDSYSATAEDVFETIR